MLRAAIAFSFVLLGCATTGPSFVTPDSPKSRRCPPPGPCPALPDEVGRVEDVRLNEISGIVESRATPGAFFVHNDSGDSPRFRREPGEPMMSALSRAPTRLPSPREQQGEAVAFAEHDSAFVTISEGVKPAVHCARLAPQSQINTESFPIDQ